MPRFLPPSHLDAPPFASTCPTSPLSPLTDLVQHSGENLFLPAVYSRFFSFLIRFRSSAATILPGARSTSFGRGSTHFPLSPRRQPLQVFGFPGLPSPRDSVALLTFPHAYGMTADSETRLGALAAGRITSFPAVLCLAKRASSEVGGRLCFPLPTRRKPPRLPLLARGRFMPLSSALPFQDSLCLAAISRLPPGFASEVNLHAPCLLGSVLFFPFNLLLTDSGILASVARASSGNFSSHALILEELRLS